MKENVLRKLIQNQIKKSLQESPADQIGRGIEKIEKTTSVKMLKRALQRGGPEQQANGLLKVIQAVSGNSPIVAKKLAMKLQGQGLATDQTTQEPSVEEGVLDTKSDKLDKTQAMRMLKQALGQRPANQQSAFVIDLINKLDLKEPAKKRLVMTIRKNLK